MDKLISVEQLQEKLNRHEDVFIVDVRPTDQRNEWKIADSVHVDAYKQLNAGDDTALDIVDVPANATVVTVCAAGRTSLLAAQLLQRKGVSAYSLEGGMKAWNYAWNTAEVAFPGGLKVIQVRRAAKGVLSYIAGSGDEAIVIDAALNPEVYMALAKQNGWKIRYVMDSHIHADYISRSRELAKAGGATHLLIDKTKVDFEFTAVSSGDRIKFGKTAVQFIHTPGHTWESTTFKIDELVMFTGDTLFIDGIGRPDLKAAKIEAIEKSKHLYKSLKQLLALSSSILVLPAHTSNTVSFDHKLIGETMSQVSGKMGLLKLREKEFVDYTLARIPPAPPNYLTIAALNKQGSYEGHQLADLEAGGNHCAIA